MTLKSSFIFNLSEEIDYPDSTDGTLKKTKKIKLLGPLKKEECEIQYIKLKSMLAKASMKIGILFNSSVSSEARDELIKQAKENSSGDKQKDLLEAAHSAITHLGTTDLLLDYMMVFKEYLLSGIALTDGKLEMVSSVYNNININDKLRLAEEYIANFLSDGDSSVKEK